MAVKANRYYNDPAMAQAASNLATLFEPPSGSDASGYASARATDLETGQRKAIWDYMQQPGADQGLIDRAGVIADLFDPSQSYYSVDTNAATQRYGYDTAATTARSNNEADNIQRAAANKSDNLAKLIVEGYGNVGTGEVQPEIPLDVISQFGGTAAVPEFKGPVNPLSETEWKAQQLAEAKEKGLITDQDIADIAMGEQELVDVLVEGKPVKMMRGEAARRGLTPVLSKEEVVGTQLQGMGDLTPEQLNRLIYGTDLVKTVDEQGKPVYTRESEAAGMTPAPDDAVKNLQIDDFIAVGPDGKEKHFVGYFDPSDMKIHDQDTGAVVPNVIQKGIGTAGLSVRTNPDGTVEITQGGPGGVKPPTEGQIRTGYAEEMSAAPTQEILKAFDTGKLPTMADYVIFRGLDRLPPEGVALATQQMTPEGQLFYQNLRSALPMQALIKSGIAVNETERLQLLLELVPLPGEAPEATKAKRRQFETFTRAAHRAAGPAGMPATEEQPSAATPASPSSSSEAAAPAATADSPATPADKAAFDLLPAQSFYIDPGDPTNADGTPKVRQKP